MDAQVFETEMAVEPAMLEEAAEDGLAIMEEGDVAEAARCILPAVIYCARTGTDMPPKLEKACAVITLANLWEGV